MEQWSAIDQEGIHLATIRVYQEAFSSSGKQPRIILTLPAGPNGEPGDEYEMDMVNDTVENQYVIAEREKEPGTGSRARTTILTGRVKHECSLKPPLTAKYRQKVKERSILANKPKRTIKRIEDEHPGDRGTINRLTSGVTNTGSFSDLVASTWHSSMLLRAYCYRFAETETEASKGAIRAYGTYASQLTLGHAIQSFPRARALVRQAFARANAATRSISERSAGRNCVYASQWGT